MPLRQLPEVMLTEWRSCQVQKPQVLCLELICYDHPSLQWPWTVLRASHSLLSSVLGLGVAQPCKKPMNTLLTPCSLQKNPKQNQNKKTSPYQHHHTKKPHLIKIEVNSSSLSVLEIHCNLVWKSILHFPAPRKQFWG